MQGLLLDFSATFEGWGGVVSSLLGQSPITSFKCSHAFTIFIQVDFFEMNNVLGHVVVQEKKTSKKSQTIKEREHLKVVNEYGLICESLGYIKLSFSLVMVSLK